ncbi:MAG: hypothetical protein JWN51_3606, partial [Phycisphaerales bacterium]|nr:hypothetical protein [Phycisphaerales bacterium]
MRLLPLIASVLVSAPMFSPLGAAPPPADTAPARALPPDDGPHDFTITAGGAFFEQTPVLGL